MGRPYTRSSLVLVYKVSTLVISDYFWMIQPQYLFKISQHAEKSYFVRNKKPPTNDPHVVRNAYG